VRLQSRRRQFFPLLDPTRKRDRAL
jgi:hypothetical protein